MMQEHIFEDRIYYRTNEFKTDRLTLVFAHGVSGSSSAWLPYEKIFENKYNILSYDIRGHGKSKKYPHYEDYEIKNFALDLHDLITHLKISKFIRLEHQKKLGGYEKHHSSCTFSCHKTVIHPTPI